MSTPFPRLTRPLAAVFAAALFVPAAKAQVVISEIQFATGGQWIELQNRGSTAVDLTGWSIYHATSGVPGTHWYGLPAQTVLGAGAFLRVHWLAQLQPNTKTDIYTGTSNFHFLFGLYAVELDATRGALGLFDTQLNSQMNTASSIRDWVSWGTTGFAREGLAVQNGRWTQGSFAPAATGAPLPTLSYDYRADGVPSSALNWFLDGSPTPNAPNFGKAAVTTIGTACPQPTRPGFAASLVAHGVPADGNQNFSIGLDRLLGSGEFYVNLLMLQPDPQGVFSFYDCPVYADVLTTFFVSTIVPPNGVAEINFGQFFNQARGAKFTAVWAVIDFNRGWLTMTNALEMQFDD